jgi:hypothetical protein
VTQARLLALFVTALGPAAAAMLAWLPQQLSAPRLLLLALVTAFAVVFGETFRPGQQPLREKSGMRLRIWVQSLGGGVMLLSLAFAAAAPRPALLGRQSLAAYVVLLAFLLVPDLGAARLPALAGALALAVLAAFRGGAPALLAVTSYALGLTAFLVLDHFSARLALRPAAVPGLRATAFREVARLMATVGWTLALALLVFRPRPHAWLGQATIDALDRGRAAPAYLQLAFFAALGAVVVHYASRLLRITRDAKTPVTEELQAERRAEEAIVERPSRERPAYTGARGAVVRAYVRFLAEASGRELSRRPDQTPHEIAQKLQGAGAPLQELTALFSRARYGQPEPSALEAQQAESLSSRLVGWLQARRESAKDATSRHSRGSPSVRTT